MPAIPYGLNLHHIDFPGTIHIEPEVFIAFGSNVTKSAAYHGFEKTLLVNGHGSNAPLVDLIARRTTLETDSRYAACGYFSLAVERSSEVQEKRSSGACRRVRDDALHLSSSGAGADVASRVGQ